MKTNRILSAITAMAVSACALGTYAAAWTKPEYSFDYEQYMVNCDSCNFCSDTLHAPDVDDSEMAPSTIGVVLKCEYSYYNSVWTIEDFPELEATRVEIEFVCNTENYDDLTDEEIKEDLEYIVGSGRSYHTSILIRIAEDDITIENARKVRNAIVEACENGEHPEIWAVEFDVIMEEYENNPFALADINGDSKINLVDATIIARYTVGNYSLDSVQLGWADVNEDGSVNIVDATLVAQYYLNRKR